MDSSEFRTENMLSAEQWPAWKFNILIIIKAGEHFDLINGQLEKPTDSPKADFKDFERKVLCCFSVEVGRL